MQISSISKKTMLLCGTLTLFPTIIHAQNKPNVIIIFTDDQGYNDLSCYGSPLIHTPCLNRMAEEGLKLESFYVSSSVSSASRAGLLTGKQNNHNGVDWVFWPGERGMPSEEITIAEALKARGYATGCFGKWHLGDLEGSMPTDQGFDRYFGIPYSNDMYIGPSQQFASNVTFREGYTLEKAQLDQAFVRKTSDRNIVREKLANLCPLFEGDKIIEYPCDQATTTLRYFEQAIDFIENCGTQPFFAYITPNMPHHPLFASEQFRGKSKRGAYGDAVEEIDWNVGKLLDFLDKKGLSENTIVIFSSDNGPWLDKGDDGGSAYPLKDGKFSLYEGGLRVPCIIRWKGSVPANITSDAIVASIDIFPTLMNLAGISNPGSRVDGVDISRFLYDPSQVIRERYLYIKDGNIKGIRKENWVFLPETGERIYKKEDMPQLFDLKTDIGQKYNQLHFYPEIVHELDSIIKKNNQ